MNLDLNLGRLDLDPIHCQPFLRYYNEHPQMDKKLINFLKFYLHMSKHDQIIIIEIKIILFRKIIRQQQLIMNNINFFLCAEDG